MIDFRRLLATGVLTATLGMSAAFGQERVSISELDWTGAKGVAYVLKAVIEQQRIHPRRNGRFVNRQDETTDRLRGELQAKANAPLDEALEAQRIAAKHAPRRASQRPVLNRQRGAGE